ncbi:hypothetical protein COO60DRAFT_923680 [Scenedesmus sp. NREL 46B-D3]|nr:hypothetical protein COO60DRAFT_923680 [Scenedesmus sp. NREL 46B-D3]
MAAAVCGSVTDANAQLVVVLSATGQAPRLITKYRPFVPQVVVTNNPVVLREASMHFGQYGMQVAQLEDAGKLALQAMDWAHAKKLWDGVGPVLVVSGHYEANADMMPTLRVIDVAAGAGDAVAAADVLEGLAAGPRTPQPLAPGAAAQQPSVPEELAPYVVGDEVVEQELVRQLSSRMSMRRGSTGTPLQRQFSKAA